MSTWQKCPICEGCGQEQIGFGLQGLVECRLCKGAMIISEITGLPPERVSNFVSGTIEVTTILGTPISKRDY